MPRLVKATPAATATALHGDPTECHGNPYGTPMFMAPRLGLELGVGLGWGEGSMVCRGGPWKFRGMPWKMPWKVLPQVCTCHGMSWIRTIRNIHPAIPSSGLPRLDVIVSRPRSTRFCCSHINSRTKESVDIATAALIVAGNRNRQKAEGENSPPPPDVSTRYYKRYKY